MDDITKAKFEEKSRRLEKVRSLQEPDVVPFAPLTGYYPAYAYGISYYEVMMDPRNAIPGIKSYIRDFDPDICNVVSAYSINACEASGAEFIRWPGPQFGINNYTSFQIVDKEFIEDDEYEDFLKDPTYFLYSKILPRRHSKLSGFADIDLRCVSSTGAFDLLSRMAKPGVKESFLDAIKAGEQMAQFNERFSEMENAIIEAGAHRFADCLAFAPYDVFSDDYRGMINTIMDIKTRPEQLDEALEYMTAVTIERTVKDIKENGLKRVSIPLHAGVDEFMSPADYEHFYWKGLKKLVLAIIDAGATPLLFCEGNYSSRLDVISDVPKGKVEYLFEKCDLKEIKKKIGPVGCFFGNFPNALLLTGTEQQVIDHTKYMLDICAPGGGFLMNCGIALDNADRKNMEAWREATATYGKY